MNNFYLRCHTIGTGPTAPIIAIASIPFDPINDKIGVPFYTEVDLSVINREKFTLDSDALAHWMVRSDKARMVFSRKPNVNRFTIQTALDELAKSIAVQTNEPARAWGDVSVLEYAYRVGAIGLQPPWHSTGRRDVRALYDVCQDLFGARENHFPVAEAGILDDLVAEATFQARCVCATYAFLAGQKTGKPAKSKPAPPVVDEDEI